MRVFLDQSGGRSAEAFSDCLAIARGDGNLGAILAAAAAPTLHVTADAYYTMTGLARVLTREHGYAFTCYDIPRFIAEMNRRCARADPLDALLDFFKRSGPKMAAMQLKRYRNEHYHAARARCGGLRPEPALRETAASLVAYRRAGGMIGRRAERAPPVFGAAANRPPVAAVQSPMLTVPCPLSPRRRRSATCVAP